MKSKFHGGGQINEEAMKGQIPPWLAEKKLFKGVQLAPLGPLDGKKLEELGKSGFDTRRCVCGKIFV